MNGTMVAKRHECRNLMIVVYADKPIRVDDCDDRNDESKGATNDCG